MAGGGIAVELSIQTRSMTSTSTTYEMGSEWENYIDINGGDYRLYFFTYAPSNPSNTESNNRLISEFNPYDVMAVDGSVYTRYTITGNVEKEIAEYSDFKVVILANWGDAHYPTNLVTIAEAGGDASKATTIDDLVEGNNATFSAETFLNGVDESHLIPFYGVREYSGINWRKGWRTVLNGDITLLRAVAKVEVVMSEDSDFSNFDSVSIAGYNSTGYCAPKGVYLRSDYDSGYTDWAGDFTDSIHLVDGANDSGATSNTHSFNRQSGTDTDTWTIYLPEYDNLSGSDYSFIEVTVDGNEYEIYFANYDEDGEAAGTADYDIFRNYLFRFYVTVSSANEEDMTMRVHVDKWEEVFDNEYEFNDDIDEP